MIDLKEGLEVSAFLKNSDKIWEGIVIERNDGVKVVLNESTNKWKKLSDLDYIKVIGQVLNEADTNKPIKLTDLTKENSTDEFINSFLNKKDPPKNLKNTTDFLNNPNSIEKAKKVAFSISKNPQIKDGPYKNEDEAKDAVINSAKKVAAEASGKATGGGEQKQADAIKAQLQKQYLGETVKTLNRLHPSLQPYLQETKKMSATEKLQKHFDKQREEREHKDKLFNEKYPLFTNPEKKEKECGHPVRESNELDYEDEDYLDVPDDVKKDIMDKCKQLLDDGKDDILDEIKSSFELTDEDAEEFVMKAMTDYLDDQDVKIRDSINNIEDEEVEKSFEDSIDKFDGPNDELLDHLVDEYEINPDEAESIWVEKKGNLEECIFAFVDIVKNRLKEADNTQTEERQRTPGDATTQTGEMALKGKGQ